MTCSWSTSTGWAELQDTVIEIHTGYCTAASWCRHLDINTPSTMYLIITLNTSVYTSTQWLISVSHHGRAKCINLFLLLSHFQLTVAWCEINYRSGKSLTCFSTVMQLLAKFYQLDYDLNHSEVDQGVLHICDKNTNRIRRGLCGLKVIISTKTKQNFNLLK